MDTEKSVALEIRELNNLIRLSIAKMGRRQTENANIIWPLNHVQGFVISYLYDKENKTCPQKEIEEELKVARSTATTMLANMEERGLINRILNENDSRQKYVSLTAAGIESYRHFLHFADEFDKILMGGMTEEEVAGFLSVVGKLKKNLADI